MDRQRAHLVVRRHVGVADWLWLGLRRRCRHCGQRYPCPPRRAALSYLLQRADDNHLERAAGNHLEPNDHQPVQEADRELVRPGDNELVRPAEGDLLPRAEVEDAT